MSEEKAPTVFKRSMGVMLALSVIGVGGWATYNFGPRPAKQNAQAETKAGAPPSTASEDGGAEQKAAQPLEGALANNIFNSVNRPSAAGDVDLSDKEYLDKLEKLYQLRGYVSLQSLATGAVKPKGRQDRSMKVYWRDESAKTPASSSISAMGVDADPNTDQTFPKPFLCMTVVTPREGGRAHWSTYRYDDSPDEKTNAADLANTTADLAGTDPPGVPRPPGLRRIFSTNDASVAGRSSITLYTSTQPHASLTKWYMERMSPTWQYMLPAGDESGAMTEGAMAFTQGHKFCLVWVSPAVDGEPTTVMISLMR